MYNDNFSIKRPDFSHVFFSWFISYIFYVLLFYFYFIFYFLCDLLLYFLSLLISFTCPWFSHFSLCVLCSPVHCSVPVLLAVYGLLFFRFILDCWTLFLPGLISHPLVILCLPVHKWLKLYFCLLNLAFGSIFWAKPLHKYCGPHFNHWTGQTFTNSLRETVSQTGWILPRGDVLLQHAGCNPHQSPASFHTHLHQWSSGSHLHDPSDLICLIRAV